MQDTDEHLVKQALSNKLYRKRLDKYEQYRDKSDEVLGKLVALLRKKRTEVAKGEFASVDEILLPLLELERAMPLDPENYIPPSCYDVLITDIDDNDLRNVAKELGLEQYSDTGEPAVFPVDGKIYGRNHRLFVPLIVEKKGKRIYVMFLYDTGSPYTYLRQETWTALGYSGDVDIPSTTDAKVHNTIIPVSLSRAHFHNVDLLGQDFMDKVNLEAAISHRYKRLRVFDDDTLYNSHFGDVTSVTMTC